MPLYVYTCEACGASTDNFSSIEGRDESVPCKCGQPSKRNLHATLRGGTVDALMADNPRWSDALGCNPEQIPDFQRTWPWMEFDKSGRCLVRNRSEKLRILKARGFVERN